MAAISGRDDDKLFKFIYPSGQGGVIDDRLSAYEVTLEDVSKAEAKLKNGVLRGMQKMVWSEVFVKESPNSTSVGDVVYLPDGTKDFASLGDTVSVVDASNVVIAKATITEVQDRDANPYVAWDASRDGTYNIVAGVAYYSVITKELETSVEGNADNGFTVNDVIGDPANIVQTTDLANGWVGGWISSGIPLTGMRIDWDNTRKNIGAPNVPAYWTVDNGASWAVNPTYPISATKNGREADFETGLIYVIPYQAAPYQTEQDINRPVLFGDKGVGDVWANAHYQVENGNALAESLTGKVCTSSGANVADQLFMVNKMRLTSVTQALREDDLAHHESISLSAPNNDSPAVKALIYPTSENQQVSLNVAYNELVWKDTSGYTVYTGDTQTSSIPVGETFYLVADAIVGLFTSQHGGGGFTFNQHLANGGLLVTKSGDIRNAGSILYYRQDIGSGNWGDGSTVRIANGQGTYNNLNGDTCLYGSNRTTKKLGYTKNRARVGEQTPGVDL